MVTRVFSFIPTGIEVIRFLFVGIAACVLAGCAQEHNSEPAIYSKAGAVTAAEQRLGDPELGYSILINNPYVSCGVPYEAFKRTSGNPPSGGSLPGRTGRNRELPYQFSAHISDTGVELVTSNCLTCHADRFNGELIIGLGNERRDFTGDLAAYVDQVGAYVTGEKAAAEWRKWADRIQTIAPYIKFETVGVNPANNMTYALMAHRHPKTLAWSQQPVIDPPPTRPLPVSVPPWWRMKKKHAMFYQAEGRGDHARLMMLAAILCTDSLSEAEQLDRQFVHVRAYLASLNSPKYPFKIDDKWATEGKSVFDSTCSSCHGNYGDDWSYPNLVIPVETVGTDPELVRFLAGTEGERFIRWFNTSFFGKLAKVAPAPGYIAPPLDGIWMTAPYLHNGSVPDLAVLLNSSERPDYWQRDLSKPEFNDKTLGWNYVEVDYGTPGESGSAKRKQIYDTGLPGYSNQGHAFGDELSDDERAALLEYIKTL